MADNLKELQENVDTVIPLNGGVASVKVVNHNPHTKEIIEKAGRLTGFPFKAGRTQTDGIVPTGTMFWNGNAMNKNVPFDILLSIKTMDGNLIQRVLELTAEGSLIHFKDFVGRSVTLKLLSYIISETFITLNVVGFDENINYAYQLGEEELCMLEFVNTTSSKDYFSNVGLDIFYRNVEAITNDNQFYNNNCCNVSSEFALPSVISEGNEVFYTLRAFHLGVKVEGFSKIQDLQPKLIIERYTPRSKTGESGNFYQSPAGYKKQKGNQVVLMNWDTEDLNYVTKERPTLIDITAEREFYDIKIEHYFCSGAQNANRHDVKLYKPTGRGRRGFVTKKKLSNVDVIDVLDKKVRIAHYKGFTHFRLRLQITDFNTNFVSKPLMYFKAVKELDVFTTKQIKGGAVNMITYQPE